MGPCVEKAAQALIQSPLFMASPPQVANCLYQHGFVAVSMVTSNRAGKRTDEPMDPRGKGQIQGTTLRIDQSLRKHASWLYCTLITKESSVY